jgi:hypothetical protein
LPVEAVQDIMRKQVDTAICGECFDALADVLRQNGRSISEMATEGNPQ